MSRLLMFVASFTKDDLPGKISVFQVCSQTGELNLVSENHDMEFPSYMCLSACGHFLYVVNEVVSGEYPSNVMSFKFDHESLALQKLNEVPSEGANPCFIDVNQQNNLLLTASYPGRSCSVFPIMKDGSIDKIFQYIEYDKPSQVHKRQAQPWAHSAYFMNHDQQIFVQNLGSDESIVYQLQQDQTLCELYRLPSAPGAGPRHLTFLPDQNFMFRINEINNTIDSFSFDEENRTWQLIQTISTLPSNFDGVSNGAEIHISNDGKQVYVTNRGHDSIAILDVNPQTGEMMNLRTVPSGGKHPRNFNISPDNQYLYVANAHSHNIVRYQLDHSTGDLHSPSDPIAIQFPMCIKFLEIL